MSGFRRYLRLPGNNRGEAEDEIAYHIEMKVEQLMGEGHSEEDARREAHRQFGDRNRIRGEVAELVTERTRRERRAGWLDAARQDIRFSLRQLRSSPSFSFIAILTIALGIGATTAIFSVVRAVLLRPLPFDGADRIVLIGEADQPTDSDPQSTTSYPNFNDWKARAKSFEAIGLFDGYSPTLTGLGEPERLNGSALTHEVFTVFRIVPALGRPMQPLDNELNRPRIVWISWDFWQNRFAGDRNVIGRSITLSGTAAEIVGVLPRELEMPGWELGTDVWIPNYFDPATDGRTGRSLNVIARLERSVSISAARAEMVGITKQLQVEYPAEMKGQYAVLSPLRDYVIGGRTRGPVLVLMIASVLVLLIACANTSNLLIARGSYRAREFAIRAALGTTRARVLRQLVTESLVLGVLGAGFGIGLAWIALRQLIRLAPETIKAQNVQIDLFVLSFALTAAVGSAIFFGLMPALRVTRNDVHKTLRAESRGSTGHSRRLRGTLAVVQLSLALALVLSAGLLIKSFANVLSVKPGFRPEHLVTVWFGLPIAKYPIEAAPRFFEELTARAAAEPGVQGATVSSSVPFSGGWDRIAVDTGAARGAGAVVDLPEGDRYIVGPTYLETMGIPVLQGRSFDATDRFEAQPVAIVDEVFARKVQRNGSALGVRIRVPGRDSAATIVGIVGHVKHYGLDANSGGQIYISHLQYPWRYMDLIVRAEGDLATTTALLKRVVKSVDPERPVFNVLTMEVMMAERTAVRRFVLALLSVFAGVALVLASVGLYGVIAYTIAQRYREFGIRLALGATPDGLVRSVMMEATWMVWIGIALGVVLAAAGARLIQGLLFGVGTLDPAVTVMSAGVLALTAGLAAWLPARRAARADPLTSLQGN